MTSEEHQGQSPQDSHDPPENTRQLTDGSTRSGYKSARLWIVLSVVLIAAVVGTVISIATGGSHKIAANESAASASSQGASGVKSAGTSGTGTSGKSGATAPKGTSTTKGKVVSADQLAREGGALDLPANMQDRVVSWQSGPGGRDLTAVSSRLGQALQASGIRQYTSMKNACAQLASSVTSAKAGPEIPGSAMQQVYAKALTELANGAADCQKAISVSVTGDETTQAHLDTATLHRASSEISAGATDVFRATAEIQIAARQHH